MNWEEKYEALSALVDGYRRERDEARREADRLRHGNTVEGDFVCPNELAAEAATMARDSIEKMIRFELRSQQEEGAQEACRRVARERDEARAEAERLQAVTASPIRVVELHDSGQLMPGINAPRCRLRIEADGYAWIPSDGSAESRIGPVEGAYRRGAEAMREACAQWVADFCASGKADALRALPIPGER